jgi:hypothetical protein
LVVFAIQLSIPQLAPLFTALPHPDSPPPRLKRHKASRHLTPVNHVPSSTLYVLDKTAFGVARTTASSVPRFGSTLLPQSFTMEKYGYPPVHTPIRERRQPFHASTRAGVKYMCLFAALIMLLLWHLVSVSQHTTIIVDYRPESAPQYTEGSWSGSAHTDLDDGTWKVPLEAHIMFVSLFYGQYN